MSDGLVQDVAEQERGALAWRQDLRGGDEREAQGLAIGGYVCRVGALVQHQSRSTVPSIAICQHTSNRMSPRAARSPAWETLCTS
jgi:hypothetical protein